MTPTSLLDNILANNYTQGEALRRLRVLKSIMISKLFGGSADISQKDISDIDQGWLKTMETKLIDVINKKDVYKTFAQTEEQIKKIKTLVIYLPFDIPEHEIIRLGEKIRSDFGKNFLMELKYDPNLIAGAALVWNGVMKDYSVRQQINQNRQTILEAFKEYIRH